LVLNNYVKQVCSLFIIIFSFCKMGCETDV